MYIEVILHAHDRLHLHIVPQALILRYQVQNNFSYSRQNDNYKYAYNFLFNNNLKGSILIFHIIIIISFEIEKKSIENIEIP